MVASRSIHARLALALSLLSFHMPGCGGRSGRPITPAETRSAVDAPASASRCAEAGSTGEAAPESSEVPLDALRCNENVPRATAPLPPTNVAGCQSLPSDERRPCLSRLRGLARAAVPLRRARAAQSEERWPEALDAFEAAVSMLAEAGQSDAGVLGELAWARYQARRWCERSTQNRDALGAEPPDGEDGHSEAEELCRSRVDLDETRHLLGEALALEMSDVRRAMLLYNLGRVEAASGDPVAAAEHLRQSLCLREHANVREAYAAQLWTAGEQASHDDLDESIRLYRRSLAVQPNADRRRTLARIEAARRGRFELVSLSPDGALYPQVAAFCHALLAGNGDEPLADEESRCEVSAWQDMHRAGEPPWSVGVLHFVSPEPETAGAYYLIARTEAGVSVLLELGQEHEDSRTENLYVDQIVVTPRPELPLVSFQVRWVSGTAYADGCHWNALASSRLALCGWDEGSPRCFATAHVANVPFESGGLLSTVQESLGRCESDFDRLREGAPADAYRPSFNVSVEANEIVIDALPGAERYCLPLREALCALERPPSGCSP